MKRIRSEDCSSGSREERQLMRKRKNRNDGIWAWLALAESLALRFVGTQLEAAHSRVAEPGQWAPIGSCVRTDRSSSPDLVDRRNESRPAWPRPSDRLAEQSGSTPAAG